MHEILKRRLMLIWILVTGLLTGCGEGQPRSMPAPEPKQAAEAPVTTPTADAAVVQLDSSGEIQAVIDAAHAQVARGNFEAAAEIVDHAKYLPDARIDQMGKIVENYRVIEASRDAFSDVVFGREIKTLDEWKTKGVPEDVNDLSEAVAVVLKARDYADKSEKETLMQDPYVQKLTARLEETALRYESEGKWIDAYAYGYYLLRLMDKKNQTWKDQAEKMTDLAMIETSLSDNSCETSAERHEGIEATMFTRAVRALDVNYVHDIDYEELFDKGIERMHLLGLALKFPGESIAYKLTPAEVALWQDGVDKIKTDAVKEYSVITRDVFIKLFYDVLELTDTIESLPREVVISQYAQAVLNSLDPHTMLVWPWEVQDFQKNIMQEFTGIGIEISKATGDLTVVSLLPDTPAYSSGLDADDVITKIDGEPVTKDMTIQCAVNKITGPAGTKVTLTVKHADGGVIEDITIKRARIVVPTIKGWQRVDDGKWNYMVDDDNRIGYLRITNFTNTTADDMEEVMLELENRGMQGLIVDLRYNTGGLLSSAAEVADKFIEKGLIVRSQPKWDSGSYEMAKEAGTHPNYPVVILINGGSASASEIVAGALQDAKYKRATLVGERTFGKGSVQTITPYSGEGSQLKYTMAYYHLPSNQRVESRYLMEKQGREDWGIAPDVEVKLTPREVREMIEVQRDNEILAKADHDTNGKPLKRHSLKDTITSDPQLQVALLVMQSKLIREGSPVSVHVPIADLEAKKQAFLADDEVNP